VLRDRTYQESGENYTEELFNMYSSPGVRVIKWRIKYVRCVACIREVKQLDTPFCSINLREETTWETWCVLDNFKMKLQETGCALLVCFLDGARIV
jgi:hypothetical protein